MFGKLLDNCAERLNPRERCSFPALAKDCSQDKLRLKKFTLASRGVLHLCLLLLEEQEVEQPETLKMT